ncbi:hypothetical protein JCM10450v2_007417 [Rhodotorula kratochvilovae]
MGRRYDSYESDTGSESPYSSEDDRRRRRPRNATKSVVLYIAIGVGLLGVVLLGYYLYRTSSEEGSSSSSSTAETSAAKNTAATFTAASKTSSAGGGGSSATGAAGGSEDNEGEPTGGSGGFTGPGFSSQPHGTGGSGGGGDDGEGGGSSGGGSKPSKTSSGGGSAAGATKTASASGETYTGKATFYFQKGNPGACGEVNEESAMICALQTELYGDGSNCGRMIELTRTDNGKSIEVEVADMCPTCEDTGYVDLSDGAYKSLGTEDEGWFDMTWSFLD